MARPKKQTCYYCGNPAEFLCDFVLEASMVHRKKVRQGMTDKEFEQWILHPDHVEVKTCDRPLFVNHYCHREITFWCGKTGGIDSIGYCPPHAKIPGGEKPRFKPMRGWRSA